MFKVGGDRVVVLETGCIEQAVVGSIGTVEQVTTTGIITKIKEFGKGYGYNNDWYQLINNFSTMSSLKQKVAQLFLTEPEKSFQKAGIFDSSNQLTEDGQSIFLTWLISDKDTKDKFNTAIVQPLLAQEEAEKK